MTSTIIIDEAVAVAHIELKSITAQRLMLLFSLVAHNFAQCLLTKEIKNMFLLDKVKSLFHLFICPNRKHRPTSLQSFFQKRMGREPTVQDLRAQINQLIREQILSREAIAMGLDEGDMVVRRRLVQKMDFLFKDLSALTEPAEDDLRAYFFLESTKI